MTLRALIILMVLQVVGCATADYDIPPDPSEYVNEQTADEVRAPNSLWSERSIIFDDLRAKRHNDLVTIKIVENASASKNAETKTGKDSSMDAAIEQMFGMPLNLNLENFYGRGHTFSPKVKGAMNNSFSGRGETSRAGTLMATIMARVMDVQPNGNLVIESRKEITVNREKQILVLRGVIRPSDLEYDNTIMSSYVAEAKIYFIGDGVIEEKQGQGWLVRVMDKIWPF